MYDDFIDITCEEFYNEWDDYCSFYYPFCEDCSYFMKCTELGIVD